MMSTPSRDTFTILDSLEQLDRIVASSHERPVVIFKHSPACGTSAQAYDELSDMLGEDTDIDVYLVDVLFNRPLAHAIAARYSVRHESPQVLVVKGGEVRWHGSHYRVTADAVRLAVQRVA